MHHSCSLKLKLLKNHDILIYREMKRQQYWLFMVIKIGLRYLAALMVMALLDTKAIAMVKVVESRLIVNATVVLPTCNIVVQTDGANRNSLDFGVYDKSLRLEPTAKTFSLIVSEVGSSNPGCSAFMAAPKAVIAFGNPGQLDELGVVTKGAGDEIRIVVRAKDDEASYKQNINVNQNRVEYPSSFAAKGRFDFEVNTIYMNKALAGEYSGSLSFVVSYQ